MPSKLLPLGQQQAQALAIGSEPASRRLAAMAGWLVGHAYHFISCALAVNVLKILCNQKLLSQYMMMDEF